MAISLASLQRGPTSRPPKVVIFGGPKVGKSTFAAGAPAPVFVQTEEGLDGIDVPRFPIAQRMEDVLNAIGVLATEKHEFQTVVLDSADWTEPLIWRAVAEEFGVATIEAVGGGYGKGYVEALKHWRNLLDGLDHLRNRRDMCVIVIAHDEIRQMTPPDGEPYDYAGLKLHKRAAAMVEEWADIIGYASLKATVRKDDLGFNKKHARAITLDGKRTLHLGKTPAYVTGNRFAMPDSVPLDWDSFAAHLPGATPTASDDAA